ncbi:hypothetical protein PMAYCL1PPCAC_10895, partial [Pristionchus mayeri]
NEMDFEEDDESVKIDIEELKKTVALQQKQITDLQAHFERKQRILTVRIDELEHVERTAREQQKKIESQDKLIEELERKYKQLLLMVGRTANVSTE